MTLKEGRKERKRNRTQEAEQIGSIEILPCK